MQNKSFSSVWLFLFIAFMGIQCTNSPASHSFLSVSGTQFVDENGRTIILNGINHVNKNPKQGYLSDNDEMLFKQFKDWGFNCVRYGINWDGLEPEPGKINENYLKEIDKRVAWAEEQGIWLILDMHQDLYGRKFGNGAPLWATLDENLPHETGEVWSDAYLVSPAIHKSFDNFWKNAPAPDGIGIQDHYIFVWTMLAKRYAKSPSVAGFDIMNEPFMGSEAQHVFPKLLEGYAFVLATQTGKQSAEAELAAMWGNEAQRVEMLAQLNNKEIYGSILDNAYEIVSTFEQGPLSTFYQRTRDAIRAVNKRQILFLEHNYFCNLGVRSSFTIPVDVKGIKDPLCAYAPHGYDLVTDTEGAASPGEQRVELIFSRIFEAGEAKGVPTIVDEWGAFYMGENKYLTPARQIITLFEKAQVGQTYWSYWNDIDKQDYFKDVLTRMYPMATNGRLIAYKNDFANRSFICEWEESKSNVPTRLYVADLQTVVDGQINLSPLSAITFVPIENSTAGYIEIEPIGAVRKMHTTF